MKSNGRVNWMQLRDLFIFNNQYQLGLKNGKTAAQLAEVVGVDLSSDTPAENCYNRLKLGHAIGGLRKRLYNEEPVKFLDSQKVKGVSVYFLIDPATLELANFFEKNHSRLNALKHHVKNLQIYITQALPYVKDDKVKKMLSDAYARKI